MILESEPECKSRRLLSVVHSEIKWAELLVSHGTPDLVRNLLKASLPEVDTTVTRNSPCWAIHPALATLGFPERLLFVVPSSLNIFQRLVSMALSVTDHLLAHRVPFMAIHRLDDLSLYFV